MAIETELVCPLGSTCETIKDGKIVRCAWLVALAGVDPQTGERLEDAHRCAMAWMPLLLIENANTNRGQTDALCSMRDEQIQSANITNNILLAAANQQGRLLDVNSQV